MQPIYLDYNATTPVSSEVLEAMLPYFSLKFGNAASTTHAYGWVAKDAINHAKAQVAEALGGEKQQFVFTSGSTESINLAIKGVWELYSTRKGKHIVTCQTEHKAVLDVCEYLEKFHGATITYLPVNAQGEIDLEELKESITDQTILVAIMQSNNETGVIHPIKLIADIIHEKGSIFMSDCTQSVGKIPLHIDRMGIDLCCVSAHKFHGPKGIGILYYRRRNPRVTLQPLIHGGGHQRGLRSGTLNVPLIVGMGKAIELTVKNQQAYFSHTSKLRNTLEERLAKTTSISINGKETTRLPNTTNISFEQVNANRMIQLTNGAMAVSTGSACTSATLKQSHVLKAMFPNQKEEVGSVRFSLGMPTTMEDIMKVVEIIQQRV